VDETALARALQEGLIAGAACDVFQEEPPVGTPLLSAPRSLLTPHIGAYTAEAATRGAAAAVENLLTVLRGERPPNAVNPEVFERQR
jgi:D-3-phosphoglycerate dehydrogenase